VSQTESQAAAKRAQRRNSVAGHRGVFFRERADRSRRYQVHFRGRFLPEGGLATLKDAIAFQGQLKADEAKGKPVIVAVKVTFAEVAAEWLELAEKELRPIWFKECRRMLERRLIPAWGTRRIGSFTPADLIKLDRELRAQGLAESTVANIMKPARGVFDLALLKGHIAASPFASVPRGKLSSSSTTREHREWTSAEITMLIAAGYELDERKTARGEYGLAIELKLRTGARLGELLGIRYGDVDFAEGVWNVTTQWTRDGRIDVPKTKKSIRRIPLAPDPLRKLAERKLSKGAGDSEFVFATRNGLPIAHGNFRRRGWDLAVKNAGLDDGPRVTPHDARHALCSALVEQGLSSADAAELLGHTSAALTERVYVGVFDRDKREERIREAMTRAQNGGASKR
jgi:integrase